MKNTKKLKIQSIFNRIQNKMASFNNLTSGPAELVFEQLSWGDILALKVVNRHGRSMFPIAAEHIKKQTMKYIKDVHQYKWICSTFNDSYILPNSEKTIKVAKRDNTLYTDDGLIQFIKKVNKVNITLANPAIFNNSQFPYYLAIIFNTLKVQPIFENVYITVNGKTKSFADILKK